MNSIKTMPDDARVWVYQANRILSDSEVKEIEKAGNVFIVDWAAHGASLKASFDVLYNFFIVISVDEKQALASGCSIDKSVHFIKEIEKQFNLNLFDRLQVAYRKGNEIKLARLNNFSNEIKNSYNDKWKEVIVFNNTITTKKEFDSMWETVIPNSWHSKEFAS